MKYTACLSVMLVAFTTISSLALAKEINCTKAKVANDILICSSPKVLRLDQQLADKYSQVLKTRPVNNAPLKQAQQAWLLERNRCETADCLSDQYANRIAEMNTQLRLVKAHLPNGLDQMAVNTLKQTLAQQLKLNQEFALENTLNQFEIKKGLTNFSNIVQGNEDMATFPKIRPTGITEDEWKALVKSGIDAGGENGVANYTLLDMNGDGQRDLMLSSYTGGTGLFSEIFILKRQGDVFVGGYSTVNTDNTTNENNPPPLYSLNGRGSNQWATWVKLNGQVYIAYVNGQYGVDTVSLLHPLEINNKVQTLQIQYEYKLSVPKKQDTDERPPVILSEQEYAAINQALTLINTRRADDQVFYEGPNVKPLCPAPAKATEEERLDYFTYGPGHYSFEIVGNVPVWLAGKCYLGQLVNWFGWYQEKTGLRALLWMRQPNHVDDSNKKKEYIILGKRRAIKFQSRLSSFDVNH
ncbi:MAG: lysozyme inhibitor LprI family protein [Methylophilaceae bacterium]